MRRPRILLVLAALGVLLLAACGEDGSSDGAPTADGSSTSVPTGATAPATPDTGSVEGEIGENPVFLRTADGFASLRAGEPYKIILRITNGFAEPALHIRAEPDAGGTAVELDAQQVQPAGEEEPGSFYAMNLELPQEGLWRIVVLADPDEVYFPVTAGPPG